MGQIQYFEFWPIYSGGLPTSSSFFTAISPPILKMLVLNLQHLSWIFWNTPSFSISDGCSWSYGRYRTNSTLFWDTLYVDKMLLRTHRCRYTYLRLSTPNGEQIGKEQLRTQWQNILPHCQVKFENTSSFQRCLWSEQRSRPIADQAHIGSSYVYNTMVLEVKDC